MSHFLGHEMRMDEDALLEKILNDTHVFTKEVNLLLISHCYNNFYNFTIVKYFGEFDIKTKIKKKR